MKKLLICLTILFSVFLFTNKVNAEDFSYTYNSRNYTFHDTGIENYIENVNHDTINQVFYNKYGHYLEDDEYIDSYFLYYSYDGGEKSQLLFFNSKNLNEIKLTFYYQNAYGNIYNMLNMYLLANTNNNTRYMFFNNVDNDLSKFNYSSATSSGTTISKIHSIDTNPTEDANIYYYTNVEIPIKNSNTTIGYTTNNKDNIGPKNYNITLHLNGGSSWDTNEICNDIGCYIVGNQYEDYTITVPGDNLISYLSNVYITKDPMQFVGWYYDEKLTQKVNSTDKIDSDKDFYAKYQYKNIEDFLNNTTFNSYTFDINYQYAVISLNNQENRDIYLGLNILSNNLEVYKYSKETNSILKGSTLCLNPIYSKENKYYYHLDSPLNSEYEVLILEKNKLKENYEFLLSDNAYITYTNDLKNLIIKDDDGNDLTIDIEDSYNYSQDNLLNSENDLLEIFKDLINNKDNNVFSYFNQVWNLMKQNKLFTYFMLLIIGAFIILIIKAASR